MMSGRLKLFLGTALVVYLVTAVVPLCRHELRAVPRAAGRPPNPPEGGTGPAAALVAEVSIPVTVAGCVPTDAAALDTLFYYDEASFDLAPVPPYEVERYGFRQNASRAGDIDTLNVRDAGSARRAREPVFLSWKRLTRIAFTVRFDEELGVEVYVARFPARLRALEGAPVEVEGYVIPLDAGSPVFALSANPLASCYFCGRGSPASVVTVELAAAGAAYATDDLRRFRGRLRLNPDDPDDFYYILEDAVPVE